MPPQLAALICILFILYLFWMDFKERDGPSNALWIPLIWMFLAGSRFPSHWLNAVSPGEFQDSGYFGSPDAYIQGSPIDRAIFFVLIAVGVIILFRRRLDWRRLVVQNKWIWLYFLFGALSILWSDFPLVSSKRWIKALGNVIMALIILTDKHPREAIGSILRRLAFLVIPLSILFIKYYPHLGRGYHRWTYQPMFTGVAMQKNILGQLCLLSGIYFCWTLLFNRQEEFRSGGRLRISVDLVFLYMTAWLLFMANSATSSVCMFVATCLFLVSKLPMVSRMPRRILIIGIGCIAVFGILDLLFDLEGMVLSAIGRGKDYTERVPIWEYLLSMAGDPLVGVGFESFWLGHRLEELWERFGIFHQAHNGYLEIYLNLGLVGLFIIVCIILSGLHKVTKYVTGNFPVAVLRLTFIVVVALYNWTEATFFGVHNMWVLLFLGVMEADRREENQVVKGSISPTMTYSSTVKFIR